jgi:hypothetical protein
MEICNILIGWMLCVACDGLHVKCDASYSQDLNKVNSVLSGATMTQQIAQLAGFVMVQLQYRARLLDLHAP